MASSEMEAHSEFEERFSDYYERSLPAAQADEIDAHLRECAACRAAYDQFRETMGALSGLHKMSAPQSFERDVAETIRRRSGGRFFGRRAFGDRIPFEILAIIVLALGLAIYVLLRSSSTGSLRYEKEPDKPSIAPGAKDVLPQPPTSD